MPKIEKNSYADMLIANKYIENMHSPSSSFKRSELEMSKTAQDKIHHYPSSLSDLHLKSHPNVHPETEKLPSKFHSLPSASKEPEQYVPLMDLLVRPENDK